MHALKPTRFMYAFRVILSATTCPTVSREEVEVEM